jgi:hypothetical protein
VHRLSSSLVALVALGCTLNVQSVTRVTASGAASDPVTTVITDLRGLATLETPVRVRGQGASGASATAALSGLLASGQSADAVVTGAHVTWTASGTSGVALGLHYDGPSPDSVVFVGLDVTMQASAALEADATDASFDVAGVTGAVRVHTGGLGAVTITGASSVDVATDGGAVDVTTAGDAMVTTTGGQVHFDAGRAVITATGGDVIGVVRGAGGDVVTGSGDGQIDVATTLSGDLRVDGGNGHVTLGVPAGASLVLDVASVTGGIHVSADGVSHSGGPFVATLGAGGPRVVVRTSSGAIDVVQR